MLSVFPFLKSFSALKKEYVCFIRARARVGTLLAKYGEVVKQNPTLQSLSVRDTTNVSSSNSDALSTDIS